MDTEMKHSVADPTYNVMDTEIPKSQIIPGNLKSQVRFAHV